MLAIAARWPRFGYRRHHAMLLRQGTYMNHKRAYRLYRLAGLTLPKKCKSKRYKKRGMPERSIVRINQRWAMDFVADALYGGRKIRILTVVDECSRECLALYVDSSITGNRVGFVLNQITLFRDLPAEIITDNGTEFTSEAMRLWAYEHKVNQVFTDPGSPTQNGYIESFNGKLRMECLNQHILRNLYEARAIIEEWRCDYNEQRPHSSLNNLTPLEYALKIASEY